MRREFTIALLFLLPVPFAAAQQTAPATPPPTVNTQPTTPTVYYAGPDVTAPQLIPSDVAVYTPRHCNEYDGMVKLSAIVDANGVPHNINPQSDDTRLGNYAIGLVATERFKPGTYKSIPAPVAIDVTLGLQTCQRPTKSADGNETYGLTLRSHPSIAINTAAPPSAPRQEANSGSADDSAPSPDNPLEPYKVGGRISPPSLINKVEVDYSDYGRENRITGICAIGLIVDANGVPQNVHVIKGLEPSMDDNAIDAVKQYRFEPAMMDGTTPVPVEITVEIDFKLVKKK